MRQRRFTVFSPCPVALILQSKPNEMIVFVCRSKSLCNVFAEVRLLRRSSPCLSHPSTHGARVLIQACTTLKSVENAAADQELWMIEIPAV